MNVLIVLSGGNRVYDADGFKIILFITQMNINDPFGGSKSHVRLVFFVHLMFVVLTDYILK